MGVVAADPQLAEEQEHLDRTFVAYDALLDALSVSRRDRQGDVFTEEVLERMRLERLRAYTARERSAVLRADRPAGGGAAVRRAARGRRRGQPPAGDQLAGAGGRAVLRRHAGRPARRQPAAPAGHRGSRRARVRRRAAPDRGGAPHRGDRRGHHAPARRRDAPDHLDDHAGAVRADQPVRPTARWSCRAAPAPARPRSACTAPRGCCTPTRSSRARACWSSGPNRVFIAYISQVLPSLGEQSVDQRPIDALVSRRRWDGEDSDERATLLGSGRMAAALSRLLWDKVGPPAAPARIEVARVGVELAPADVAEVDRRGPHAADLRRGPRALPRPARRPRRHRGDGALRDRGAGGSGDRPLGRPADAGVPEARVEQLAAADPGGAGRAALQEPAPAHRGDRRPVRRRRRSTCSSPPRRPRAR